MNPRKMRWAGCEARKGVRNPQEKF